MLDEDSHTRTVPEVASMQARAASVGRVLYGYYHVPDRSSKPIDFIINPEGMELRSRKRCGSAAGSATWYMAFCWALFVPSVLLQGMLRAHRAFCRMAGRADTLQAMPKAWPIKRTTYGGQLHCLCLRVDLSTKGPASFGNVFPCVDGRLLLSALHAHIRESSGRALCM